MSSGVQQFEALPDAALAESVRADRLRIIRTSKRHVEMVLSRMTQHGLGNVGMSNQVQQQADRLFKPSQPQGPVREALINDETQDKFDSVAQIGQYEPITSRRDVDPDELNTYYDLIMQEERALQESGLVQRNYEKAPINSQPSAGNLYEETVNALKSAAVTVASSSPVVSLDEYRQRVQAAHEGHAQPHANAAPTGTAGNVVPLNASRSAQPESDAVQRARAAVDAAANNVLRAS